MKIKATTIMRAGEFEQFSFDLPRKLTGQTTGDGWLIKKAKWINPKEIELELEFDG